jgi:hypothetical protein
MLVWMLLKPCWLDLLLLWMAEGMRGRHTGLPGGWPLLLLLLLLLLPCGLLSMWLPVGTSTRLRLLLMLVMCKG